MNPRRKVGYSLLILAILYLATSVCVSVLRGYSPANIARTMIKQQYLESKIDSLTLKPKSNSMRVTEFSGECILNQKDFREGLRFELRVDHPHFLNFWQPSEGTLIDCLPIPVKEPE